jgi:hypothetical protein
MGNQTRSSSRRKVEQGQECFPTSPLRLPKPTHRSTRNPDGEDRIRPLQRYQWIIIGGMSCVLKFDDARGQLPHVAAEAGGWDIGSILRRQSGLLDLYAESAKDSMINAAVGQAVVPRRSSRLADELVSRSN